MFRCLLIAVALLLACSSLHAQVDFTARPVVSSLRIPWDMVEGPGGYIWYTERIGLISRVHPDSNKVDTLLDMKDGVSNIVEIGLLGMALHPAFETQPYVYAAYAVRDNEDWVKRITRWKYNGTKLVEPEVIYELRPAQQWHQGCRILILPDSTMMFTNGDQPSPDSTFSLTSEIGKTIRINLDGSIPADNPFPGSKIWSIGHRNPQGICRTSKGEIYVSEHGDNTEDEINRIVKGGNYGWPRVEGRSDTPSEKTFTEENSALEPAWSTGTLTLAPAGIEYYEHDRYPALKGKLISTYLKGARLLVHDLNDDHTQITATRGMLLYRYGRIRDVLVTSTGRLFVCTGNVGMRNIEPFPKPTDDVLVELVPVWDAVEPRVRALRDTIVMRANPGDTLRTALQFCSDGTPANYTHFFTNPGNIFEQRFWQDGASTEDTTCYGFRVHFMPQTEYPYTSQASVYYTGADGSERSTSAHLVGLPIRGLAQSTHDTSNISKSGDAFAVTNIGLDSVTVNDVVVSPAGVIAFEPSQFPLALGAGETRPISVRLLVDRSLVMDSVFSATLVTNGIQSRTAYLRVATTSSVGTDDQPFVIAPNPVQTSLRLQFPASGSRTIQIHDARGKMAFSTSTQARELTIPVSMIADGAAIGMYTMVVIDASGTHTSSFVVTP